MNEPPTKNDEPSEAVEEVTAAGRAATALLDAIPGAYEQAQRGRQALKNGHVIALEDWERIPSPSENPPATS